MIKKILVIIFILFLTTKNSFGRTEYFQEGVELYKKNKLEDAKFKFEQDIVYNPKSELSYLYLSKIYNKQNKKKLEEKNLKTVILLNPKNEDAIYYLTKLKLSASDYQKSKELNKTLKSICSNLCGRSDKLKFEIENLLKK